MNFGQHTRSTFWILQHRRVFWNENRVIDRDRHRKTKIIWRVVVVVSEVAALPYDVENEQTLKRGTQSLSFILLYFIDFEHNRRLWRRNLLTYRHKLCRPPDWLALIPDGVAGGRLRFLPRKTPNFRRFSPRWINCPSREQNARKIEILPLCTGLSRPVPVPL